MKTKTIAPIIAAALVILLSREAKAAITISNFTLTQTSVSFDIAGTFPTTTPPSNGNQLYFSNPIVSTNPGFVVGSPFTSPTSATFSGTQIIPSPTNAVGLGFDDFFAVTFDNPFSASEAISGTFSASWISTVFDPTEFTGAEVYWGYDFSVGTPTSGTYLTSVPVPELSSTSLFIGAATLAFGLGRRRKLS